MIALPHINRLPIPPTGSIPSDMERELIIGLRLKDQKSLSRLYKLYGPALKGIIHRIVINEELTEDLLQETFVKIWTSFHQYQDAKGRLFTWMSTLARNVALDQLRRKSHINSSKNVDIGEISFEIDVIKASSYNTDTIGVRGLMRLLNPLHRVVLNMVYFEGYTHTEVAEALSLPLGTVKSRIRFGLMEMKKLF
ncbi:RNA polymerase sigma factor (sigma-70 family) [Pedobacter sp. UYP24]